MPAQILLTYEGRATENCLWAQHAVPKSLSTRASLMCSTVLYNLILTEALFSCFLQTVTSAHNIMLHAIPIATTGMYKTLSTCIPIICIQNTTPSTGINQLPVLHMLITCTVFEQCLRCRHNATAAI